MVLDPKIEFIALTSGKIVEFNYIIITPVYIVNPHPPFLHLLSELIDNYYRIP